MQKIFDGHFHIIDPKYPLVPNRKFMPAYYTVADYKQELEQMGLASVGGTVVSGSFQGIDQSFFADALAQLGANYVGVTHVPVSITDAEILALDSIGIRHIRFIPYFGLTDSLEDLEALANRVYRLCGWKTEFFLDLAIVDASLHDLIFRLPAASVDHFGMGIVPGDKLKKMVSHNIPIRISGFGRVAYSRPQLKTLIRDLYAENPQALIFGTDLPSTQARYRFSLADIDLIKEVLDGEALDNVLWRNGQAWYQGGDKLRQ